MNLEAIIQSEASQKEKNKYCIIKHMYGIWKDGIMNLFAGQERRHKHKEQTFGHSGGRRGWDDLPKFRLKLKKIGKTTRPFKYDLNKIPYDYTVKVAANRSKELDLIDRVPEEL